MPKLPRKKTRRFDHKVRAFFSDLEAGKGFEKITLDNRSVRRGTGKHKGLIEKRNMHLIQTKVIEAKLLERISNNKIIPINYELVPTKFKRIIGGQIMEYHRPSIHLSEIQEYYRRPSLNLLRRYLIFINSGIVSHPITRDEVQLCRSLLGDKRNSSITLGKLGLLEKELNQHVNWVALVNIDSSNIIILNTNKKGQIKIALVDV
ncbi:MAG: hypothetical protein Q7S21_01420 [archaeon]|nr:hypothetical protein [archaeon]